MPFYKHALILLLLSLAGSLAIAADDAANMSSDSMNSDIQNSNQSTDQMTNGSMMNKSGGASQSGAMGDKTASSKADMTEQSGFSRGSVVRSVFTSAVDQREPVDKLKNLNTEQANLVYFTELRDMDGQTAKHRWQYNGEVVAEVDFNVRGPRWRVWSSKALNPEKEGEWKVSVLNGAGDVIAEEIIQAAADTSMPNNMQNSGSSQSDMMNGKMDGTDGTGKQMKPSSPDMSPAMME